jgi:hypothetical protein
VYFPLNSQPREVHDLHFMIFIFVRLMRGAQVIGHVRYLYFYLLASVERAAEFSFFSFSLGGDFANLFPSTMEFCVKMRLFGGQRNGESENGENCLLSVWVMKIEGGWMPPFFVSSPRFSN